MGEKHRNLVVEDEVLGLARSGTIWKHFKGGLYRVIDTVRDSETLKLSVVYTEHPVSHGLSWVRPLSNWHEQVPNPILKSDPTASPGTVARFSPWPSPQKTM